MASPKSKSSGIVPVNPFRPPQVVPQEPQPVPNSFVPVFQVGVTTPALGLPPQPVSPYNCLSEASALELKALLADPDLYIFHAHPNDASTGVKALGTQDPDGAPWFGWTDGAMINAGSLAIYWTHGQSEALALSKAKGTIVLFHEQWAAYLESELGPTQWT